MSLLTALVALLVVGCSNENKSHKNMNYLDFDVVWGGVYASKDQGTGKYKVFRLIDFTQDAYHSALYTQDFDEVPTLDEVRELSPFIGHAPIDSKGLLNRPELQLIGALPVDEAFFDGYSVYLENHGVSQGDINDLVANLIAYSKEPPLPLRLRLEGEALVIEER